MLFNGAAANAEKTVQALNTGARQHTDKENKLGVYYVLNPHSGGVVSEMIGAAYTKLNDVIGTHLGLTPAEKTNKEVINEARKDKIPVELVCHSRGSNTCTNSMQSLGNDNLALGENKKIYSITSVTFNGAASNAHKAANLVDELSKGEGKMYQATHPFDGIGRWIGWNPTSQPGSGRFSLSMEPHSAYFGFEPRQGTLIGGVDSRALSDRHWGAGQHSEPVLVLPDRLRHPSGK